MRSATAARLALGTVCAVTPGRVLGAVGGPDQDDPRVTAIARVLGAHLLLQAGADQVLGPRTRRVDLLVELTHALSMLPAALVWPTHRRSALVSGACATGIALLDAAGEGESGRRGRGAGIRQRSTGHGEPARTDRGSQASRRLSRDISRSQRWP